MKNILVVVSHPDDEVLGLGGLILSESSKGSIVTLCILSKSVYVRKFRPSKTTLISNIEKSSKILGINQIVYGDFPNIEFNTIPHINLVKFIENLIIRIKPDSVITHHPSDLNNDHQITSQVCQVAIRVTQRQKLNFNVHLLLFMEVLSSTEWNVNPSLLPFIPNYFYPISETTLNSKIAALEAYIGVMRPYPHPRSKSIITSLAMFRGSQVGFKFAEAFQVGLKIENYET